MDEGELVAMILATGALGTAAFGIVEGFKMYKLGETGFDRLELTLGPLWDTLIVAYGENCREVLVAQYRGDTEELRKSLRQGVRIGLTAGNAPKIAAKLPMIGQQDLIAAATSLTDGTALPDNLRNIVGRYELAADARIDAAMLLASETYAGVMRWVASGVAILIALIAGILLVTDGFAEGFTYQHVRELGLPLIVGIAAVPLAPIAKDVATALQSAAHALRRKEA